MPFSRMLNQKGPSITFSYVWSRPWVGGLVLQKRQSRKLMRGLETFSSRRRSPSFTFAFDAILASLLSDTTSPISPKERCSLRVLTQRYDRWYPLLQEEINLVAASDAAIFAVGKVVSQNLERLRFQRPFTPIIHYSALATPARSGEIVRLRQEDAFEAFRGSVSIQDVADTVGAVLREAHVPRKMYDEALSGLLKANYPLPVSSLSSVTS